MRPHNKKIYVRRGAQNLEVKGTEALRRLELDKGVVSYEKQPVSADLAIPLEGELARALARVTERERRTRRAMLVPAESP
jgi:hypothetical protein